MTKRQQLPEVSTKSTKEQILAAYNEAIAQLTEKQIISPQEQQKKVTEGEIVTKAVTHSSDNILADLSNLKSQTIKQIDNLSEQLLTEFAKLANLREAISLEQKHLQELYQINETANTLAALMQAQSEQREQFKLEMEQQKADFEQKMLVSKAEGQKQHEELQYNYQEQKEQLEKARKREEEEYVYALEIRRRKETDEYNNKKATLEKESAELRDSMFKREAELTAKEQTYQELKAQVEQFPIAVKEAVAVAEENLRTELMQQHEFTTQLKEKDQLGEFKLKEQQVSYLESKIQQQEALIKELSQKADLATQQVQSIACRALDTSIQRFVTANPATNEDK